MNRILAAAVLASFALACGPGPQGPAGPPGPQGPAGSQGPAGGGGSLTLDVPSNEKGTYLTTKVATGLKSEDVINLADLALVPASASAVYVEVNACVASGSSQPATIEFKTPASAETFEIYADYACDTTKVSRQVWMPLDTEQTLSVKLRQTIGLQTGISVGVKVLGWYAP